MSQINAETIVRYQQILRKDPSSKVFAALAEHYRLTKQIAAAEKVARAGVKSNPDYVSGYVVLGRILMDQHKNAEALQTLKAASQKAPENLLALQLLGECHLRLNESSQALKVFKMALFFNPQNEKAKKAVEKLESLSATEFENDIFQMSKLKAVRNLPEIKEDSVEIGLPNLPTPPPPQALQRGISLVDAFLVRNDFQKAREALQELQNQFPQHPQLEKRWNLLEEAAPEAETTLISPLPNREKTALDKKIQVLEAVLQRIKDHNTQQTPRL